jgi:TetR/AcrR family transcriptional regulator, fatty acid metabolism regulator protein
MKGNSKRRRLTREVRETQILDAAVHLFREKGYSATSTLEIAQRAGVVEGTIFRYFPTKRQLMITVVERSYEKTFADYSTQLEAIVGTWNRLRYLVWRHLKNILEYPFVHQLIEHDIKQDVDYHTTRIFHFNRAYTHRTVQIIEEAIRNGEFDSNEPVRIIRDMIYGGIEHYVWRYCRGEGTIDIESTADHITNFVYRSMVARPISSDQSEALVRIERRLDDLRAEIVELKNDRPQAE